MADVAATAPPITLEELQRRVTDGIVWLTEHDPLGAFHYWFESGITPQMAMPAQDESRREDYRAYYNARRLWDRLDRKLLAREAAAKGGGTP